MSKIPGTEANKEKKMEQGTGGGMGEQGTGGGMGQQGYSQGERRYFGGHFQCFCVFTWHASFDDNIIPDLLFAFNLSV